jgi:hypothetical protein
MTRKTTLHGLQRGILLFWSLWFFIVCLTNLFDVLVTFQILPFDWPAVSNNYLLIEKSTSIYHFPHWMNDLLFFIIIAWEGICSILFFRAFLQFRPDHSQEDTILYEAFGAALALFCAFILACEVFVVYDIESAHLRILIALLASILFVRRW